jgi:N-acetylmuramoyl-L-alanine amidase
MINSPNKIILHCSATPDDSVVQFGASDIRQWHLKRGFSDIGYHLVIRRDGEIETGRPQNAVGAHCEGHNENTLGICYIGTKRPTPAQLASLCSVYALYFKKLEIDFNNWFGHYEFTDKKECPCFSMDLFREMLKYFHQTYISAKSVL